MNKLTLSQAYDGFVLYKRSTGKSDHTLRNYRNTFNKIKLFFTNDPLITDLDFDDWVRFFAWLRDTYQSDPDGVAPRGKSALSPKSILNIHTDLCSFYTWAVKRSVVEKHIMREIDAPDYTPPVIETFTETQIKAMLAACKQTRSWKSRADVSNQRPTADRDTLIILMLLDTGVRAEELCNIKFGDIDLNIKRVRVAGKAKGTGKKERHVYFGKLTARALWDYLTPRLHKLDADSPIFTVTHRGDDTRPLQRDVLRRLIKRIGDRAGVERAYPHRFRHTFAITYLRNGGDVLTLQALLGHSSLEMVQRYARIVAADCAKVHQTASPVDNWKL